MATSTLTVVKPDTPPATAGAALLDRVYEHLGRFISYPSEAARIAHALWIAHTHAMEAWESTPRIAFESTEPGSGKTRCMEVTETLVPRPVEAVNVTPAYLFRRVSAPEGRPTVLHDEIDTLFNTHAKDKEEIRGMLNAGHRRGAMAGRCVVKGKVIEYEDLPAYCAVALAGLPCLPATILSRSVIIRMRRRRPDEKVEPYRRRDHAPQGHVIRDDLARWIGSITDQLTQARPKMPDGIQDRDADVWEALLAVADACGGHWPARARVTAVTLVTESKQTTHSLGVRLLSDLRTLFGPAKAMSTEDIIKGLIAIEEAPWADLRGKEIESRRLSSILRPYDVKPKVVRIDDDTVRGYASEDLHDPWTRYLPPVSSEACVTSVTSETPETPTCPKCDGEGCTWCSNQA